MMGRDHEKLKTKSCEPATDDQRRAAMREFEETEQSYRAPIVQATAVLRRVRKQWSLTVRIQVPSLVAAGKAHGFLEEEVEAQARARRDWEPPDLELEAELERQRVSARRRATVERGQVREMLEIRLLRVAATYGCRAPWGGARVSSNNAAGLLCLIGEGAATIEVERSASPAVVRRWLGPNYRGARDEVNLALAPGGPMTIQQLDRLLRELDAEERAAATGIDAA